MHKYIIPVALALLIIVVGFSASAGGKCRTGDQRPDWQQEALCPSTGGANP